MIDVKIRKVHPDAEWPTYAHPGDAGMDVKAVSINETEDYIERKSAKRICGINGPRKP